MTTEIEAFSAVWSSAITAIATLSAVIITSAFHARQSKSSFDAQELQRRREFKLAKLEEFYELFDRWRVTIECYYGIHLSCYLKKLDYSQALELTKTAGPMQDGDAQRLMMLLHMHFPALVLDHTPVNEARRIVVQFLRDPSETKLSVDDFVKAQQRFEAACTEFKEKIILTARNL